MFVHHTLDPIYNKNSKVLILGTMPSPKSVELGFYYGHPRNRFWKTLKAVYNVDELETIEDKKLFLKQNHIALFDVLESCEIKSASDSSIKNTKPNDLTPILKNSNIKVIFTTGTKAYSLYNKYLLKETKIEAIPLPSTSPAYNKKGIEEELIKRYSLIKKYTDN